MASRVDPAFKPVLTFPAGQSVTNGALMGILGAEGLALLVASASWTAADIGFQISEDNVADPTLVTNWYVVTDEVGNPIKITGISTSAAQQYLAPSKVIGALSAKWIRLISRSSSAFATPVNQVSQIAVTVETLAEPPGDSVNLSQAAGSTASGNLFARLAAVYRSSVSALSNGQVAELITDALENLQVSLGTLIHGEDETNNVLAVAIKPVLDSAYGDSFANFIAANAGASVKSGAAHLKRVQINTPVASGSVAIYNNTSASTPIAKITLPASLLSSGPLPALDFGNVGVFCSVGIFIVIVGTMDVTVTYN